MVEWFSDCVGNWESDCIERTAEQIGLMCSVLEYNLCDELLDVGIVK